MTDPEHQDQPGDEAAESGRAWRPSLKPQHRLDEDVRPTTIVENSDRGGLLAGIREWVRQPLVKVGIGVSLFILAIIAYDATLNLQSWTERPPKAKATEQERGIARRPDS